MTLIKVCDVVDATFLCQSESFLSQAVLSLHLLLRFLTEPALTPEAIASPQEVPPLVSGQSAREGEVKITVQQFLPLSDVSDGPKVFLPKLGVPVELRVGTTAVIDSVRREMTVQSGQI